MLNGVEDADNVVPSSNLNDILDKKGMKSIAQIRDAVLPAGLKPIRACLRTICTTVFGLMPVERHGIVPNLVLPTAIDRRNDFGQRDRFDVYYGMADRRIASTALWVSKTA